MSEEDRFTELLAKQHYARGKKEERERILKLIESSLFLHSQHSDINDCKSIIRELNKLKDLILGEGGK